MVNFNLDSKDSNKYLKHLIFISCKKIIIIEIICFLLSTFFILVGIFDDKEALMYGFGLIMIDIILGIVLTRVSLYYKKNLAYMFKFVDCDGKLEYALIEENSQYILENLTRKTITRINQDNIKLIIAKKRIILIKMKVGNAIFLPSNDELISFLSARYNLKK